MNRCWYQVERKQPGMEEWVLWGRYFYDSTQGGFEAKRLALEFMEEVREKFEGPVQLLHVEFIGRLQGETKS